MTNDAVLPSVVPIPDEQAKPVDGLALRARIPLFPIVGIGASAGGLKAIGSLLADIPSDTGMAFVVVQHLDPSHESHLPTLLAKVSRIPVEDAIDGHAVMPNHVYVITPNTRIAIDRGILRLTPREPGPGLHLTIDAFFHSLASDRRGNAIGVILSGTGSDGTLGLAAIKAAGGVTFAQDGTAEYASMPQSAVSHGHVDHVLCPSEIAKELDAIAQSDFCANETESAHAGAKTGEDAEAYATIIGLLHAATAIDFTHYRSTTIMRRTRRRMALIAKKTLGEYARHLAAVAGEVDELAKDILINVTSFYRDMSAFTALTAKVFPALAANRPLESPIRLWVVGCSTGQEVYTLAIEMMEYLRTSAATQRVQIFATDISDWALAKARYGWYPASIADEVPTDRLKRYFSQENNGFRIIKEIRDLCVFAKHDVTADTPFSRIDLISCRNVLIYLGPVLQNYVLPTFHFSLTTGGFLLIGPSETLGRAAHLYETLDEKNHLYRSLASSGRIRPQAVIHQKTGDQGQVPPAPHFIPSLSDIQRTADLIVLNRFAPAGVLITEAMEIIQFRGHTNPYLEPSSGEASLNLLGMLPFGVAEALRDTLNEAKSRNLPVRREHVIHRREQSFREIAFEVIPIKLPTSITTFIVLFEEQPAPMKPALSSAESRDLVRSESGQREVDQLRIELSAATNYVHSLVEQNHALLERLKESLEEAQSSTEEFRSTNEELQTAKEEVESTNEELVTINDELRGANGDLAKTSAALRASCELTSAIVETMRYPLLVLAANLRVESANQAFLDAFGVNRQETIGQLVYELGDGQWNIPELRRLLEDILPNHSVFDDFVVTHDFRRIGRRTMLLNGRQLKGDDDRSRLIVLVLADITEQTRITKDLKDTSIELQRSNAELDQFAAVASHDLQEPLRMISSFIGLLQLRYQELFDTQAREYMDHVTNGALRLREMIEAILIYSRVGHQATNITDIDSSVAFANAIANLKGKIEYCHATVISGALPRVQANREQVTQLLQNLLSNALKFRSSKRDPVIHFSVQESDNEWIFAVADNGVGIDESHFHKIFTLFQRVHSDRTVRGSGIGLATCKKIVEHHKGRIWVESKLDVGSTIYFSLPK